MLSWFDAREAEAFGHSLGRFFVERIPAAGSGKRPGKPLDKQLAVVDKMDVQIQQFKASHQLNIYKKAKLGNAFRSVLHDAGHAPDFVDKVVSGLLLKL